MRLGILYTGGKDSSYAMFKASKENEIKVLISVISENEDSYMFHTPKMELINKQSEALGIPLIKIKSKGVKEKELEDLKKIIKEAVEKYRINGVVTGAIASNYQASRIQKICDELKIKCINPLWGMDQEKLLREIVKEGFKFKIVKVAADGLDEKWINRVIDEKAIDELIKLKEKYGINICGEGGEIETLVIDSPMHKFEIDI